MGNVFEKNRGCCRRRGKAIERTPEDIRNLRVQKMIGSSNAEKGNLAEVKYFDKENREKLDSKSTKQTEIDLVEREKENKVLHERKDSKPHHPEDSDGKENLLIEEAESSKTFLKKVNKAEDHDEREKAEASFIEADSRHNKATPQLSQEVREDNFTTSQGEKKSEKMLEVKEGEEKSVEKNEEIAEKEKTSPLKPSKPQELLSKSGDDEKSTSHASKIIENQTILANSGPDPLAVLLSSSSSTSPWKIDAAAREAESIHKVLERIFEVTFSDLPDDLDRDIVKEELFTFESGLIEKTFGKPLLNVENIDKVLIDLLSSTKGKLKRCYGLRLNALNKFFLNIVSIENGNFQFQYKTSPEDFNVLTKEKIELLKQRIITHSTNLLTNPKTFNLGKQNYCFTDFSESLYQVLWHSSSDFGSLLINKFDEALEEEDLSELLNSLFFNILSEMKKGSFARYRVIEDAFFVFETVIRRSPKSIKIFLNSGFFYNSITHNGGIYFQKETIFGVLLDVSIWESDEMIETTVKHFDELRNKTHGMLGKVQQNLMDRIDSLLKRLAGVLDAIIRSSSENKDRIIFWFDSLINVNSGQRKLGRKDMALSSNGGFLLNMGRLLLMFCKPFIDDLNLMMKKYEKIDINYLAHPYFEKTEIINKEACLVLKEATSGKDNFNFLTQMYFLQVKALDIISRVYEDYQEFLLRILLTLKELKKDASMKNTYDKLLMLKYCMETQILDAFTIEYMIKFFSFSAILYLHHNKIPFSLEWLIFLDYSPSKMATPAFNRLPSKLISSMADFLSMISYMDIAKISKHIKHYEIVIQFLMYVMGNTGWLPNTHDRAKIIQSFILILPSDENNKKNNRGSHNLYYHHEEIFLLFKKNEFFVKGIIPALFTIFIDVEKTGTHTQFYDRLQYRADVCKLLSKLLAMEDGAIYGPEIVNYIEKNQEKFLSFMMKFLGAIIYCLDDCFEYIKKIKKIEEDEERKKAERVDLLADKQYQESMEEYKKFKNVVKHFSGFLNTYYTTLADISNYSHQEFLKDELRDKLANNLNYTLNQLYGSDGDKLQVRDIEALEFKPKKILSCVINLLLKFEKDLEFLEEIINDSRSFSVVLFQKTADILECYKFPKDKLLCFRSMIERLRTVKIEKEELEEKIMDGCPENFKDALISDIMKDPVMLPSSKQVVDRTVIKKHLLNEEFDPFTREKLTMDMLIPMSELKREIEDYIKEKTGRK